MSLIAVNPPSAQWPGVSMGILDDRQGVFVTTGHAGTDTEGTPITSSIEDQIVALFENLRETLTAAGLSFEHVARITAYIKSYDPEFMRIYRDVRQRYVNPACPPTSVMVQAGLYDERLLVEAEIIAFRP